jgi:hypothetical protein
MMEKLVIISIGQFSYKLQATSYKIPEYASLLAACSLRLAAINSIIQNPQFTTTRS